MIRLYKVLWTETAASDLEAIIDFIALESPRSALKVLKLIRKKAETLKRNPRRGRHLPELAHLPAISFRELVVPPWRLVYHIDEEKIQILSLLDSRRDLEELLFERLTRVKFT